LGRLDDRLQANVLPVLANQLDGVEDGAGGLVGFDCQLERLAVTQGAEAIGALRQTRLVEQTACLGLVELGEPVLRFGHVERRVGDQHRIALLAQAEETDFVDALSVDRVRQGLAEARVAEDGSQARVVVGLVYEEGDLRAVRVGPPQDTDVDPLLALLQQRVFGDIDVAELHVDLAIDRLEIQRLFVLDQLDAQLVDVR
jgi:hypothetical protein